MLHHFRIYARIYALWGCSFLVSPAYAETLAQSLGSALEQNPSIIQSIAAEEGAHAELRSQRSHFFPEISASSAAGRVYGDNSTSRGLSVTRGAGYSGMWEGNFAVNQMLFDSFHTFHLVDAAQNRAEASKHALQDAKNAVGLQTTLAYLNVLRVRAVLDALYGYEGKLENYTGKIGVMVESGAADSAELQQARSLALDLKKLLSDAQGQARAGDVDFQKLTSHFPEKDMTRPDDVVHLYPDNFEEALAQSRSDHPQILRAQAEIKALEQTRKAQVSVLYPSVGAELSAYKKDVADVIGGEVTDERALVRVNWAFSTGGAEIAQIRKAGADLAQGKAKQDEIIRDVEATIRLAYSDLTTTKEQKNIAAEQLSARQKLLDAHKKQFEGGKVRILQLLQSENQLLAAQIDFINADFRQLAAQYSVLGGLNRIPELTHVAAAADSLPPSPPSDKTISP
ncbi:MAG: TolC family protein [Pseudobdellovibrionaceae bacterium]